MGELKLMNGLDVEELSDEELQVAQTKILNARLNKLAQKINEAGLKAEKAVNKTEQLEEEVEEQKELAVNSMRVNSPDYEWVNLSTFGEYFNPTIGSKTFGKLLRVVGLAKRSSKRTVPYRKHVNRYAKARTTDHYTNHVWHYEKCLNKIDNWLEENGHYNAFYSTKTPEERKQMIDKLHRLYC